jgi:uncharacterized small protein (DUF1192 family)
VRPGKPELLRILRDNERKLEFRNGELKAQIKMLQDELQRNNEQLRDIEASRDYLNE